MLDCQKDQFSLEEDITYLNCAYSGPLPKVVEKAAQKGLLQKAKPYLMKGSDFFEETEEVRKVYARIIGVKDPKRIVSIPAASYGMAIVAHNVSLSSDQNIILVDEQFPSNVYSWKRLATENKAELRTVKPPQGTNERGKNWNLAILKSIDSKTRLVSMPHVHWADGTLFDLIAIRKRCDEVGALLIIDGTQSVGALPFDVEKIRPDALICAGYKWLMGPYSTGLAYFGSYFDNGIPIEENWINRFESENFANLVNYQDNYQEGALRYEVGQHSNFILMPMVHEALKCIESWGIQNIQDYCQNISKDAIIKLKAAGFEVEDAAYRSHHLFGVRIPKTMNMETIKQKLEKNKVFVSFRGSAIRVSPNIYNTKADMDKFVSIISA
jgi:selenocysteine lyase/cysteine desulfurase